MSYNVIYNNTLFFQEVKDTKLEIVFVSADGSEEDMVNYMLESHGNWFTTKFKDPVTSTLNAEFTVRGIPKLVVMRKNETGEWTKVTEEGREIVQNNKENFKLALEKFQNS